MLKFLNVLFNFSCEAIKIASKMFGLVKTKSSKDPRLHRRTRKTEEKTINKKHKRKSGTIKTKIIKKTKEVVSEETTTEEKPPQKEVNHKIENGMPSLET